jgi:hypothetical protein
MAALQLAILQRAHLCQSIGTISVRMCAPQEQLQWASNHDGMSPSTTLSQACTKWAACVPEVNQIARQPRDAGGYTWWRRKLAEELFRRACPVCAHCLHSTLLSLIASRSAPAKIVMGTHCGHHDACVVCGEISIPGVITRCSYGEFIDSWSESQPYCSDNLALLRRRSRFLAPKCTRVAARCWQQTQNLNREQQDNPSTQALACTPVVGTSGCVFQVHLPVLRTLQRLSFPTGRLSSILCSQLARSQQRSHFGCQAPAPTVWHVIVRLLRHGQR